MSKSTSPLVSIVIPTRSINNYILQSIKNIIAMDFSDFEILIFSDLPNKNFHFPKTRIIASGPVGPAEKRNLALKYAKGKFLAFLDDDAYPDKNWLTKALANFDNSKIAAVGGPGFTPLEDNFWQQASGWTSASPLGSGPYAYRFLPDKKRFVDDYPSMNLIIRKNNFEQIHGFDSSFFPGEDTKLCLDIINLDKKIIYDPEAIVFHHRRSLFIPHLKQIGSYGLHRGFFARQYPQTSARLPYFLPSILLLLVILNLINFALQFPLPMIISLPLVIYSLMLILNSFWILSKSRSIMIAIICLPSVLLTHLYYGVRFIQGFIFTKSLFEKFDCI